MQVQHNYLTLKPYKMIKTIRPLLRSLKPSYFNAPILAANFSSHKTFQEKLQQKHTQIPQPSQSAPIYAEPKITLGPEAGKVIEGDKSLTEYMNKVYRTTGLSFASYLGFGYMLSHTALAGMGMGSLLSIVGAIGCYYGFKRIPMIQTKKFYQEES